MLFETPSRRTNSQRAVGGCTRAYSCKGVGAYPMRSSTGVAGSVLLLAGLMGHCESADSKQLRGAIESTARRTGNNIQTKAELPNMFWVAFHAYGPKSGVA